MPIDRSGTTMSARPAVVLIFFRRSDCVSRCLEGVRKARPPRLWLVQDAPRPDAAGEARACQDARLTVEAGIDWPCEVRRLYSAQNEGPSRRIEGALHTVFSEEDRAIILEEDCVPHGDFVPYCEAMLDKFSGEPAVGQVSGCQFVPGGWRAQNGADYSFAYLAQIWGWATWRRAWMHFDASLSGWPEFSRSANFKEIFPRSRDRRYWRKRLDDVHAGRDDVWDYRWAYSRWRRRMLSIIPRVNLVTYAGFREDALHTRGPHPAADLPGEFLAAPYRDPVALTPDRQLDRATADILFSEGGLPAWWRYQRDERLRRWWRRLTSR